MASTSNGREREKKKKRQRNSIPKTTPLFTSATTVASCHLEVPCVLSQPVQVLAHTRVRPNLPLQQVEPGLQRGFLCSQVLCISPRCVQHLLKGQNATGNIP